MTCFIQTLNLISEQQEAACYRREFTEGCAIFLFSSFLQVLRTSVVLPEGKIRASVNLITFTFIQLAIVYVSYLSL